MIGLKKLRFLLVILLIGLSMSLAQVGRSAPDFTLVDDAGNPVTLSEFLGAPLIVNIWASWCAPCVEELPLFESIFNQLHEDTGLNFLLVNNNEAPEPALRFLREQLGITLPAAVDATRTQRSVLIDAGITLDTTLDVLRSYRVVGMPTTFFISEAGVINYIKVGLLLPQELPSLLATIGIDYTP